LQGGVSGLTLLFFEDFTSGLSADWQAVNDSGNISNWNVMTGEYRQDNFVGFNGSAMQGGYHRGTYTYLTTGAGLTDYQFSVKATPLADSGQDIGVMVRLDTNNYSYSRLSFSTANGFGRLETNSGSVFSTLAKNARGYQQGSVLNITMEVQGPIIIARVNGEKLFGAYDASLTGGTVALYCRDICAFDDVNIQNNDVAPTIVIAEPSAYSIAPGATFNVSAVVLNKPVGAIVDFQLAGFAGACTAASDTGTPGLFSATCTAPSQGIYQLTANLNDQSGLLDTDTNLGIGVGDNYAVVGDSLVVGLDDNTRNDGVAQNGWVVSSQGYEAILTDYLNVIQPQPSIVYNAGTPGDNSTNILNDRITSVIERYADANNVIINVGVNDASGTLFTPSGMGCSGTGCNGTYKGNIQSLIDQIVAAGKTPIVTLVAPRFGDAFQVPYADPANHTKNLLIRDEYNFVITNELTNNHQIGADLYGYFLGSENRFYLYATNLHPNALGYNVIAHLMNNAITGGITLPFVAGGLCVRLIQAGVCESPLTYKENLLELDNSYYVDQLFTLTNSIPSVLADGRWIMTRDQDLDASNTDYLSFNVPEAATLYVAYDDAATSVPAWLSFNYVQTALLLNTDNPSAPVMRLYRKDNVIGSVALGGAEATVNGAAANYIVILVKN